MSKHHRALISAESAFKHEMAPTSRVNSRVIGSCLRYDKEDRCDTCEVEVWINQVDNFL